MRPIDQTHAADLSSWVESANQPDSDFPIQNLPYCRFQTERGVYLGVGIGDQIVNLTAAAAVGLFDQQLANRLQAETLNSVMSLPVTDRIALRQRISQLLSQGCQELQQSSAATQLLVDQSAATFLVPADIGDYTDFYASVFHATNVGSMFRPNNPLLPNYKYIPIGYHGRGSSILISGSGVRRPRGQLSPVKEGGPPSFEACKLLDYELEVGFYVGGGNRRGESIPLTAAEDHLFGMCLVNDWSARDIQKWEYQPLGPFLAKSFATSVSPWVVTMEALAPFRCPAFERPASDPPPLPYLSHEANESQGGVDIELEVSICSQQMRDAGMEPMRISRGNFRDMYWTIAQMLTHHSSNGCNLQPGDLMASGTVSNREKRSRGCLLELTWDGELDRPVPGTQRTPIQLPSGESRTFLADGDEVVLSGFCRAEGYRRIGFGSCSGRILPA